MLLRPHLQLLRTRLLIAAIFMLGIVVLTFLTTSSEDLNPAALWNHACTCPLDPDDLRILLSFAVNFALVGGILAFMGGYTPALAGSNRFFLTRPQSRLDLLLAPFLIGAAAVVFLPGLAWLVLLGWLYTAHAPALNHLVAILELIPAASHLGPHPTFWALAIAAHFGRFYLAGISLGLCIFVFFNSSRWFLSSRFLAVKLIGIFSGFLVFALAIAMRYIPRASIFLPSRDAPLTYVPSYTSIALHFAFAAAWFYGTLWIIRDLEL